MKTSDIPTLQKFHLSGVKHILPEDALEAHKSKEAILIDIREENEISAEHIEHVLFLPMSKMKNWKSELPREENIILLCNIGTRSTYVANYLLKQGFTGVVNMDGGLSAWKNKSLPYVQFKSPQTP